MRAEIEALTTAVKVFVQSLDGQSGAAIVRILPDVRQVVSTLNEHLPIEDPPPVERTAAPR